MNEEELRKRFGLAKEYFKKFLELSDEELRILIAEMARKQGLNDSTILNDLKTHKHFVKKIATPDGAVEVDAIKIGNREYEQIR